MISQIIWSKDRPMQCDALLRSMEAVGCECAFCETIVLWRASSDEFRSGYAKLKGTYRDDNLSFVEETDFRKDIIDLADECTGQYILGNSDDNLFINPFPDDFMPELEDDQVAMSLRLNPNINHCQPASLDITKPTLYRNVWFNTVGGVSTDGRDYKLHFDWRQADSRGCWGYPHPCDSNIYRRDYFLDLIKDGDFKNPGTMEIWMDTHRNEAFPEMVCFDKSVLVNICNNEVMDTGNPSGSQSTKMLNDLWLQGKQIDIKEFLGMSPTQCHIIRDFTFEEAE